MYQKNNNIELSNNDNDNDKFKSLESYKPSGNLIYNKELLQRIEDKFKNN